MSYFHVIIRVTEVWYFRGSLYRILHRPQCQIDEKRRIKMALDVVRQYQSSVLFEEHLQYPLLKLLSSCRQEAWIACIPAHPQLFTGIWSHQTFWLIRTGMSRYMMILFQCRFGTLILTFIICYWPHYLAAHIINIDGWLSLDSLESGSPITHKFCNFVSTLTGFLFV